MSRESESEQTQRTVAELLAQYGGGSGEVAPRRRRRRAEDVSETAPQAIIDRVNSDSGRLLPVRDEPPPAEPSGPPPAPPVAPPAAPPVTPPSASPSASPPLPSRSARAAKRAAAEVEAERTAYAPPPVAPPPVAPPPATPPAPPLPTRPSRAAEAERTTYAPAVDPAEETRVVPPITDDRAGEPSRPQVRPVVDRPSGEHPVPEPPRSPLTEPTRVGIDPSRLNPDAAQATRVVRPAVPPPTREPVTEVLPRISDQLTPNVPLEALPTESVLIVPPAPPALPAPLPDQTPEDWFGEDEEPEEERPAGESTQFHPYVDLDEEDEEEDYPPPRRLEDDEEPAGLADIGQDDEDEPAERSPGREWLIMIGQLAVGVVGGAALWLGFSFLWRTLAPAALVVALAVTVGLVMLVRRIRRADDLQTTVLAVLVGLIVTVSPAAMLLVKS
ncbi:hypothetical protein JOF41_005717 [Saccharothrix coeruleofusca]|uniref:hypothetical protein n=1 Tax=Saccharothrix coeruleofusca TaxID=33919 RepID=UPI001AE7635D|nr:hypothetical protein [Saccharothrix coeruleofusca]MBP2339539.1 hypothetical protein [Saccharothrix coeruleofusca]